MEAGELTVENIFLTIKHKEVEDRPIQPIKVSQSAPVLYYH